MGYTTEFEGYVEVRPALDADEIAYLKKFAETRRMNRTKGPYYVQGTGSFGQDRESDIRDYNSPPEGQPGLWCQWEPSEDGTRIQWNGAEKFYNSVEWMQYLIDHFLRADALAKTQTVNGKRFFTFQDHVLNGVIEAQGEDEEDRWFLVVRDNLAEDRKSLREPPKGLAAPAKALMFVSPKV